MCMFFVSFLSCHFTKTLNWCTRYARFLFRKVLNTVVYRVMNTRYSNCYGNLQNERFTRRLIVVITMLSWHASRSLPRVSGATPPTKYQVMGIFAGFTLSRLPWISPLMHAGPGREPNLWQKGNTYPFRTQVSRRYF